MICDYLNITSMPDKWNETYLQISEYINSFLTSTTFLDMHEFLVIV